MVDYNLQHVLKSTKLGRAPIFKAIGTSPFLTKLDVTRLIARTCNGNYFQGGDLYNFGLVQRHNASPSIFFIADDPDKPAYLKRFHEASSVECVRALSYVLHAHLQI